MAETQTVEDLKALVPKGEQRLFAATEAALPSTFYIAMEKGINSSLRWLNAPEIHEMPRAEYSKFPGYIPLSALVEPHLVVTGEKPVADFHQVFSGAFFVSMRLAEVIETFDPGFGERRPVTVVFEDGRPRETAFLMMPHRVIDAIDIARTEVMVTHHLLFPGADVHSLYAHINRGYSLREEELEGVATFLERQTMGWLWRRGVFKAAFKAGCRGLYGESLHDRYRSDLKR